MTNKRSRKSTTDRKVEILQTALDLAFEAGPGMVSTGMIAQKLGLTQPSIYKHFSSKEDIWIQVANHLTTQIRGNLHRCRAANCSPQDRLKMQVLDHLRLVQKNPALPEIMVLRELHKDQSVLRQQILQSMSAFHAALVENVAAAQKSGIFREDIDTDDAASLILGIIQSLVLRMLLSRNPAILLPEGERLLALQLAGFSRNGE